MLLVVACGEKIAARDGKDPHKGWVDYDNLDQKERLEERPGNYQTLAAVAEFFDRIYAVRPDYSRCAYPLQLDTRVYADWDELQKELDERAQGTKPKNKLRQFNVQIRSLAVRDADTFAGTVEFKKWHPLQQKRFTELRKRHPGRAVVALVHADLESLQSPKVESGDEPLVLYLASSKGGWRVAWFEK